VAFLYSGPAINILAIIYSARLLGYDIGAARAIGAIVFSVIIGIIMAFIFRKEKSTGDARAYENLCPGPGRQKNLAANSLLRHPDCHTDLCRLQKLAGHRYLARCAGMGIVALFYLG